MVSSYLSFLVLSNLELYSPNDYLNHGLNTSERNCWDGTSLLHQHLRGSVDGIIGKNLFYLNLSEQVKCWQSSI